MQVAHRVQDGCTYELVVKIVCKTGARRGKKNRKTFSQYKENERNTIEQRQSNRDDLNRRDESITRADRLNCTEIT
jgi:hypothetical protein